MLLITGATGDVGRAVLTELADTPQRVRALVSDPQQLTMRAPNIEVAIGDLSDPSTLGAALEGVDAAFLASSFEPRMVDNQVRFVEKAKKAGLNHIVQLSGIGADSHRCCVRLFSWFGQVEDAIQASKLKHTRLRPTFYFQNLLSYADQVTSQGVIAGPFRQVPWTWVDARDVGAVAAITLTNAQYAGGAYTLTGPDLLTYVELAERMSRVIGKTIRYSDMSANEARGRMQAIGVPPVLIEAKLELWDAYASGFIYVEPTQIIKDLTGREPRNLDAFLREHREKFLRAA